MQALALAEALGMRPLQAHCHRGLGTLYATTGQQEQARAELSAAVDLYRTMEMTFWLPRDRGGAGAGGRVMTVGERQSGHCCNTLSPKAVTVDRTCDFHPALPAALFLSPVL